MMRMPRSGLLTGCALGALLATLPAVAEAQSFAGTPTVVAGDASISPGPGTHDIFVLQPETVINWTVTNVGAPTFTFQPTGTTATFEGDDLADFTVLNRILPFDGNGGPVASAAFLDGTVESYVNPVGGSRAIGGQVWFYSPTGIIAGPNSLFNVGSLLLTTNDIQFVPAVGSDPGSIYGPGGAVQLRGAVDSQGFVEIQPGAQINALGTLNATNAYVALVAPRVVQNGFVSADGNIVYAAAEQVDMTINGGLFDFRLLVGTTDAEGIVHGGTTTGPASTGLFGDQQRISMVALPKNDALTMLLQGSIGYTPALSVFDDGSSVVLAAGYTTADPFRPVLDPLGSIDIGPATFLNDTTAWATNDILLHPKGGTISFGGNTFLNAEDDIDVNVQSRENLFGDGDLTLRAGIPGQGGDITVLAENADFLPGGVIDIAGSFSLDASSDGILPPDVPPADQFGGTISITADGGLIEASSIFAEVDGSGDFGNPGGLGDGGQINLLVEGFSGTIRADSIYAYAGGYGGASDSIGGNGIGGTISLLENDGMFDFGSVSLSANGAGGESSDTAGNGIGGSVLVTISQQAQVWDSLSIDTSSSSGGPSVESNGLSGSAEGSEDGVILRITGPGSLTINSDLVITANAYTSAHGVDGFTGEGGKVLVEVADGGSLTVEGTLFAHANAVFSSGQFGFGTPDTTPTQTGGDVTITADGGSISAFGLDARAEAGTLFASIEAGTATGGEVTVSALDGGSIRIDDASGGGSARISADAYGAPGPIPADATGGIARVVVSDGQFTAIGDLELSADAVSGEFFSPPPPGPGFDATGGSATVELLAGTFGTAAFSADDVDISALGDSRLNISIFAGEGVPPILEPTPIEGDGGTGTGGTAGLTIAAGMLTVDGLTIDSSGTGGVSAISPGATPFQSGNGFGGNTSFAIGGGEATIGTLDLLSTGTGGDGSDGPAAEGSEVATLAGDGIGGNVTLQLDGGSLVATDTVLDASGFGGAGMDQIDDGAASDGGDGDGGTVAVTSALDWAGFFSTQTLGLRANGEGGEGGFSDPGGAEPPLGMSGNGGDGIGGTATVDLADGEFSLGFVDLEANGTGGYSGDAGSGEPGTDGGEGIGGYARFALIDNNGPTGAPGSRTMQGLDIDASGLAGFGSNTLAFEAGGEVDLTISVLDPDSALEIVDNLNVFATGNSFLPSSRIDALISGAPLDVGGSISMQSSGPLTVTAIEPLRANFQVVLSGSTVTTSGLVQSGTDMFVFGQFGISAERLIAGGLANLDSNSGNITSGDITAGAWIYADAFGSADLGNLVAGIDAAVTTRGGNLTVGDITAGDDIWLSVFGTNAGSLVTAGNLVSTGLGADDAPGGPGELWGAYPNEAGPTGNVTRIRSSGSLLVGDVQTPGRAIFVADQGTMTLGNLSGDEALLLLGAGDIGLDTATTGGVFYVANQSMFLPNLPDAYDPASLAGLEPVPTSGDLTATGAITAGSVSVSVDGDIALPEVDSAGTTFLEGANGNLVVEELRSAGPVTARGSDVAITSSGSLLFADARAFLEDVRIVTAGDLAIGGAFASNEMILDAGGTFTLSGQARALTIDVLSSDIEIDGEAQLGLRDATQSVTLRNRDGESQTYIGGDGGPSEAYNLDEDEIARIFSDDSITILADADITIDDFALNFGAGGTNIGAGGTLEISSPADINIVGDVRLRTSGADDTFRIDPRLIALNTDTGSISMFAGEGSGDNPTGTLELVADRVVAATGSVIDQLETLTDLDAITDLLDQPGGDAENPLSAGAINVEVIDGLYIQNSGASEEFADRRGFSAGALNIDTESSDTQIAINGQIVTQGGPVTGLDTIPLVSINGEPAAAGGQFDPRSSINGCVIGTDCGFVPEPEPRPFDPPSDDDLTPIDPVDPTPSFTVAPLIELAGTDPLVDPPLVDEPITGVGNDDLWEPPCDDTDGDGICPEDGEQQ